MPGIPKESANLFPFHRSAFADDDEILQLPSLASNVFQDWWGDECQHDYDVARGDKIWLNPFLGDTKKLVGGKATISSQRLAGRSRKIPVRSAEP